MVNNLHLLESLEEYKVMREFWLNKLTEQITPVNLPHDYISKLANRREILKFEFTPSLAEKVLKISKRQDMLTYVIMVATLVGELHKYTGDSHITVGIPVYGGTEEAPLLLGEKANPRLIFGMLLEEGVTFKQLITTVKNSLLEHYSHQHYPLPLIWRDLKHEGEVWDLARISIGMRNLHSDEGLKALSESKENQLCLVIENVGDNLELSLDYNAELFSTETMEYFIRHYLSLMEEALKNLDTPVRQLELMDSLEMEQVLTTFNQTRVEYSDEKTINAVFAEQVEKTPDKIAVALNDKTLTYQELQWRVESLAAILRMQGVKPGQIVGVIAERSLEMVIGLLAIIKAGGVYLPIDAEVPAGRIQFMLTDSGAEYVLTYGISLEKLGGYTGQILDLGEEGLYIAGTQFCHDLNTPDDPAYLIYTSGSTGQPKGVLVKHQSVVNLKNLWVENLGVSAPDRIAQFASPAFDASVWEIFMALFTGAALYLIDRGTIDNHQEFERFVSQKQITVLTLPPVYASLLTPANLPSLRLLITAGSEANHELVERWKDRVTYINAYGPTEATICASYWQYTKEEKLRKSIPIGRPIPNARVYILDAFNCGAGIGVVGELCIAGVGLAKGYLNRTELTAEKFVANPFQVGEILYRTGDLARWLPDGILEFLGRIDSQVKIRGYRIELGEIEYQLMRIEGVQNAVVMSRSEQHILGDGITMVDGERYLSAYIVAERQIGVEELREHLKAQLPGYMIPAYFTQIAEIPLTVNGKVDYAALPLPMSISTGAVYAVPETEVEEKLAQLWQDLLMAERVGVNDNFFELGGHSLRATVMVAKVEELFKVRIPLSEVFKTPTVRGLAGYIANSTLESYQVIPRVAEREYYPVWDGQARLFTLQQIDPESTVYNLPTIFTVEGELNLPQLESAFQKTIERHETLRSSFKLVNDEIVMQVHPAVEFHLEYMEIDRSDVQETIQKFVQPFDLGQIPLLRGKVLKLAEQEYLLLFDIHHIISDGVAIMAFVEDLIAFYCGAELPELDIQYKDFAVWQKELLGERDFSKEESYLLEVFSGNLPVLEIPTDYLRPAVRTNVGSNVLLNLSPELTKQLRKLAQENDSTLYMVVLTAFYTFLYKYSGQEDIIVGSPAAGRTHAELEKIVGMFINSIAMRNFPKGEKRFKELLQEVRVSAIGAFESQEYQFDRLIEKLHLAKDLSRNPLFDVFFAFQNFDQDGLDLPGLKLKPYPFSQGIAKFDLLLFTYEIDGGLLFNLEYNTKLFKASTAEQMLSHFVNILQEVAIDSEQRLGEINFLSPEERNRILFDFNDTGRDYQIGKPIHVLFEEQVRRSPDNVAVSFRDESLSYRELNRRANRLARKLQSSGVKSETVVAVMMDKCLELMVSLLAILKAGGAYLPIDPAYPKERILYMLENARAKVLITDRPSSANVPFTLLENFEANGKEVIFTGLREHIVNFDSLPVPDRSLIDLSKYKGKIGMASVTDCISLQTTRGCPYKCLFCHKVWSKHHVFRSAENIYAEVEYYYKRGVTHFEILDDCFNLNAENGMRFFKLVIANGLKIQLFFPNGLRGDILTPEYIDLMVEAGVVNINLSLETASERLQKLIKKNLNLDRFKSMMEYIANQHPNVILELATMHGFPTETEEEALMTLDFIKDIQWIHFPYIHILKVYPNTEMEELALENGVRREDIMKSVNMAYHEIPETLPFSKSFTRKYQADFLNEYFLKPERLKAVLPVQMRLLSEEALIQKYDAYLPIQVRRLEDVLEMAGVSDFDLFKYRVQQLEAAAVRAEEVVSIFDLPQGRQREEAGHSESAQVSTLQPAKRLLLLDLSQHFSSQSMLYKVMEQPLGLLYLLTYLKQELGQEIDGRIYKSGVDFDSFAELEMLVQAYQPDMIGIRTLSLYKEFFHETAAILQELCPGIPLIVGGPYATSDYNYILQDSNVDLAVIGEGEYTFTEIIRAFLANDFRKPADEVLKGIRGIAFAQKLEDAAEGMRQIMLGESIARMVVDEADDVNLNLPIADTNLSYVMYTSGSTGKPKGVMVEHRQVNNCISWMQEEFGLAEQAVIAQRTNLTFDPSVWEIFWPLYRGAEVRLLTIAEGKDVEFLKSLLENNEDITMMYCPASLVTGMTYLLQTEERKRKLKLPWLIIGAEAISREVVNTFYGYFEGQIVNTYGPTECTINNTYHYLERDDNFPIVPIGKPVANNQIYILSKELELRPINVPGEIYIAGASVARGYMANPSQTQTNFLDNPFGPGKLYKTGDIGRWLENGQIEIMGRVDYQVKIRGYRIELGEIETALLKHPEIQECAVVVRDTAEDQQENEVLVCKQCGMTNQYPEIGFTEDGVCSTCADWPQYKDLVGAYFKEPADLERLVKEKSEGGVYDCMLLFSGGSGAGYALYQLVERGFRVLTATYDHGYFSKGERDAIKMITNKLGVDHVFLHHENSDAILRESIRSASTVCKGCFFTSASLAADYAESHGIKVVIGATLSRGQIIENKVNDLVKRGIVDVQQMEQELRAIQKMNPDLNASIFELINLESVNTGQVYDSVTTIDFYRYFDVTNQEMLEYLYARDAHWLKKKKYAIYSTNCPLKQVGDFCHLQEKGYHYYGSATAFEYRLGHITRDNVREDLHCHLTQKAYENFTRLIGYVPETVERQLETKYICAYFTASDDLALQEIREHLTELIPDYMVPSYFVRLEQIPLTEEGKVNRKALPKPEGDMLSGVEYVAPRDDVETALAKVWQEVLGIGQVGIEDNFFDLGGDSIRAIRVISGMQKYGYKLEVKDLFKYAKIKDLHDKVSTVVMQQSQEPVEGTVELLPIQKWFFKQNFTEMHHWNQAVMLFTEKGFDPEVLRRVFTALVQHHDALRMVYRFSEEGVEQYNGGVEGEYFELEVFEFESLELTKAQVRIQDECEKLQSSLNLTIGPLVKLGLFKTCAGDHLLIVVHHLVIDGVSWRILFEDFALGYRDALTGKVPVFQAKTSAYREWASYLIEYAISGELSTEVSYWQKIEAAMSKPLPKDIVSREGRVYDLARAVHVSLTKDETLNLLTSAHQAYNTEVNDLLLTALGLALFEWVGHSKVAVELEGHGREMLNSNLDITRTVGWFTVRYPVILDVANLTEDLGYGIKLVKETLRQIPNKGLGYGVLKYLTQDVLSDGGEPEIIFNYLGQFDADLPRDLCTVSPLKVGRMVSGRAVNPHTLSFDCLVQNGSLQIALLYNSGEYEAETVEGLLQLYREKLSILIDHCLGKEGSEYTPADYGARGITLEQLAELENSLAVVLDVTEKEEREADGDIDCDDIFADFD